MYINRYWSTPYKIGAEWSQKTELTPSRLTLTYPPYTLETNSLGFRFNENLINSSDEFLLVLGGSTTFGHYCSLQDSWPYHLSSRVNLKVINLSQPKADIWASFIALIDFVRAFPNLKISKIITYDGVNQNQAFGHFMRDSTEYQAEHMNFRSVSREIMMFREITDKSFNIKIFGYFIFGPRFKNFLLEKSKRKRIPPNLKSIQLMDKMIQKEGKYYLSTLCLLKKFCENILSAEFIAFLEPTLFDVLPPTADIDAEDHTYRRIYYQKLYNYILENDLNIWDLRKVPHLTSEDFIDFAHLTPSGHTIICDAIWKIVNN